MTRDDALKAINERADKAADFDWIGENIPRVMFEKERSGNIVIAECDPFMSLVSEGESLLEAVQNAMESESD